MFFKKAILAILSIAFASSAYAEKVDVLNGEGDFTKAQSSEAEIPATDPAFFAFNQVGFTTDNFKELALINGTSDDVEFLDDQGKVVLKVTPPKAENWSFGDKKVSLVDFTELKTPGKYTVRQGKTTSDKKINIADNPFGNLLNASLKFFYYQRASMELEEKYAGKWKRAAGHIDNKVKIHPQIKEDHPDLDIGKGIISSPKGWYDAGDYGKYMVNSGITTQTLLALYEHYPEFFKSRKWNIPKDGNLPDLLAEIKYNLDWMLSMQREDGGVYNKLTTKQFCGFIMPEKDNAERYAIGLNDGAAFSFAHVMATAYRIYEPFDKTYANKMLTAAKKAYNWAVAHDDYYWSQPSDVGTGQYGNSSGNRELAKAELWIATNDQAYEMNENFYAYGSSPEWVNISGFITYEIATSSHFDTAIKNNSINELKKEAYQFVKNAGSGIGAPAYSKWGSNSFVANDGIWLLYTYYVTGESKYYETAIKALDYLLGKNTLDKSFVTGYGTNTPMHPHHRPSEADGVAEPIPGMLVGGPNRGMEDSNENSTSPEDGCSESYGDGSPAGAYNDHVCSYASNEVAINWNAPLAYLVGAIKALNSGYAPSFAHENVKKYAADHKREEASENPDENETNSSSSETLDNSSSSAKPDNDKDAISINRIPSVAFSVHNRSLSLASQIPARISIFDMQGQHINTYNNVMGQINLGNIPSGRYIARISHGKQNFTAPLLLK